MLLTNGLNSLASAFPFPLLPGGPCQVRPTVLGAPLQTSAFLSEALAMWMGHQLGLNFLLFWVTDPLEIG
jgi:hypothetical protein